MAYLYENLNDEEFQQMCQTLLVGDYPDLQCFPIGQPDGGRDGFSRKSGTVLQVKFKRKSETGPINADWAIAALTKELPKIARLVDRGATKYVLATNAPGTAHLDGGSIDRVDKWLAENVTIQSHVLWRDDIDRRLDRSSNVALRYPGILTFQDGWRGVAEGIFGRDAEVRLETIRAYLADQRDKDRKVRFQQIELTTDLDSSFVDVPLGVPMREIRRGRYAAALKSALESEFDQALRRSPRLHDEDEDGQVVTNAGAFMLSPGAQSGVQRILLQGAPGQGKSTLAQHVCQRHRETWLKAFTDGRQSTLGPQPLRVPIKVDLRHLGRYLIGDAPYDATEGPRTFEVFLAWSIRESAGGRTFSVDDVAWLLRSVPILLFLDGLDEVAEPTLRERVVESVAEMLSRSVPIDAQVVVTSRPAVFGTVPDLERHGFVTLTLQPLASEHIHEFADKWVISHAMSTEERTKTMRILSDSLKQAHIHELVRSPMQLAILLSLIAKRGSALPEARTDLYRDYVDLIMAREGNKSTVVAEHHDILMHFLGHLAWLLHLGAESSGASGSISLSELRSSAADFLASRSVPGVDVAVLFEGNERMYVMVDRNATGRFEFEVQPMREFFCAQHLYQTAPARTAWTAPRGDISDRFRAMASNPFWLNVARFYAGFFRPGELAGIRYELQSLLLGDQLAAGVQSRVVARALLRDRVFRHKREVQDEVADLAFDALGMSMSTFVRSGENDEFPVDGGRDRVRRLAFEAVKHDGGFSGSMNLLAQNDPTVIGDEFCAFVLEAANEEQRTERLGMLLRSGATRGYGLAQIEPLIRGDSCDKATLNRRLMIVAEHRPDLVAQLPEATIVVESVADGDYVRSRGASKSLFELFLSLSYPWNLHRMNADRMLSSVLQEGVDTHSAVSHDGLSAFGASLRSAAREIRRHTSNRSEIELEARRTIAECMFTAFGERWASYSFGARAATWGVDSLEAPASGGLLFHQSTRFVDAVTTAMQEEATNPDWWLDGLGRADTRIRRMFWAALLISVAEIPAILSLAEHLDAILDGLSDKEYQRVYEFAAVARRRVPSVNEADLERLLGARSSVVVGAILDLDAMAVVRPDVAESQSPIAEWIAVREWMRGVEEQPDWTDASAVMSWLHLWQERPDGLGPTHIWDVTSRIDSSAPTQVAIELLKEPHLLPWDTAEALTAVVMRDYNPTPVKNVVEAEKWEFE